MTTNHVGSKTVTFTREELNALCDVLSNACFFLCVATVNGKVTEDLERVADRTALYSQLMKQKFFSTFTAEQGTKEAF